MSETPQPLTNLTPPEGPAGSPVTDPVDPPPQFTVYDVFVGKEGLRAGWSIVFFIVLTFFLLTLVRTLGHLLFPHLSESFVPSEPIPWLLAALPEGEGAFCLLLATWIMAKIESRPFGTYGYRPQHAARYLFTGLACGVALLSVLVLGLRATGLLVFDARLLFGGSIARYGIFWLAAFLLVGLCEESSSRGYLQFTLSRGLAALYRLRFGPAQANTFGFWTSALILSFAFGLGHRTNPGESPLGLLSAGLAGLLFCFSLWRTGSLWWAIGFHAAWDWAQSFLYGVADSGIMAQGHLLASHPVGRPILSGGLTGPEGSLLLLPVVALSAVAVIFVLPRTHSGYKPGNASPASLN